MENSQTTMETLTKTNPVGEWIEECRNVNSSWACMIPSNIILYRLELDSIFSTDEGWYAEWHEEFNSDHDTDYTVEEFEELVIEYILPEVTNWTAEKLAEVDVAGWLQTMDDYCTKWEYIREALSNEGVSDERLEELDEELNG
jgi:hypothetical protein